MQRKVSRGRKALFAVLAILFGIAAAALIAEAVLRLHPPDWLKQQMKSLNIAPFAQGFGSDVGWSVERSDGKFVRFTSLTHFKINYYEYQNDVNIDRWGGRVVNGNVNRMDRVVVPFLGDSFMLGVGVEDNQTFVSILNSQSSLQYLNLGVPGSALPQHLDILDFRIKELHSPRICIFSFFTGNDYTDIVKYYVQGPVRNSDPAKNRSHLLNAIDFLIHRSHVFGRSYLIEFCKQSLIGIYGKVEDGGENRKAWAWSMRTTNGQRLANTVLLLMDKRERFRKRAELYLEKSLDRLVKLSQEEHFLPVFIVVPDKQQVEKELLSNKETTYGLDSEDYDPALPDKIFDEELRRRGIPYYDLFDCLNGKTGMYYKIDGHFTPGGCRTVAKCLGDLNTMIAAQVQ